MIPLFFSHRVRARAKHLGFSGSLATHVSYGKVVGDGRVCTWGVWWWLIPFSLFTSGSRARAEVLDSL